MTPHDTPATAWFWALDNDMQGAVVLGILSLAGLIVWAVRGWRDARRTLDNAPREIRTSWAPEIEDRALPWAEADDAAWADYLSDMPYDQEADQ